MQQENDLLTQNLQSGEGQRIQKKMQGPENERMHRTKAL